MKRVNEKRMERTIKQNQGITLVALVVTIVVLIILATVSINAVLGDNGIIKKAQQAKLIYENSIMAEEYAMNQLLEEYENLMKEPPAPEEDEIQKPAGWTSDKVTPIEDGNGGVVPLPEGFYYVGGDINTGLVISDKSGDTMEASGTSMGNQFVWIPVPNEAALTRSLFDAPEGLESDYTEPLNYRGNTGYEGEANEYNTMRSKVLQYGGFYIGRYEAGVNSTTLRTATTTSQTAVSKKGVAPYNYVPWGKAINDPSEATGQSGVVYLAKNMYSSSNSVTSTLIYGCEWDAMCRYIGDYNRNTPAKSLPELTGSVGTDVSKNIYDLAGNCSEWTMEGYLNIGRVGRGGRYDRNYPTYYRSHFTFNNAPAAYQAFRCALYIK